MSATKSDVWDTSMKWDEMVAFQRIVFLCKVIIAVFTFGFAFPHVMD